MRGLACEQRGGVAHVEPFRMKAGRRDLTERFFSRANCVSVMRPSASSAAKR